jgi:iron complex outermembrane receptor protein
MSVVRAFWCAALILVAGRMSAQDATIRGDVRDARTREPIVGAFVRIPASPFGTSTDTAGTFLLRVPAGEVELLVSHIGYRARRIRPMRLEPGSVTTLEILMDEEAVATGPVIVTASRRVQSFEDAPVSMALIDAGEIIARVPVNADEVLRSVSGVSMVDDQISIRGSSGYSRGVGSRVLLLLDGIPLLTGDTGEINWESIPVQQIERIEVVKGAGSALYGSSALGGVVNIITQGVGEETRTLVRSFGGLYDRFPHEGWNWSERRRRLSGVSVTVSGRPAGVGLVVHAHQTMDESHRQNDVAHRYGLYSKIAWEEEGGATWQATGNLVQRLNGNFFWWKSLLEPGLPPDDQQQRWVESTRGSIGLEHRRSIGGGWGLLARAQYYGNDWFDRIGHAVGNRSTSGQLAADAQLTQTLGERALVVAGTAAHVDRVTSNIFGTHPGVGVAIFGQAELRATDDVTLSAGLRWDRQKVSALAGASQVDPRIAVTMRLTPLTTLRGSWGTGFRYPSIGELYTSVTTGFGSVNVVPNPALRPERSMSFEAGVHQVFGDGGAVDAAFFVSEYRQLIEAGVDPLLFVIRFNNVARARIVGAELTAARSWLDGRLLTRAGVTAMEPRDLGRKGPLKFRPRFLATATVEWRGAIFQCGGDYRFASRQEAIDDDLVAIADIEDGSERVPIHVVDLRGSFDVNVAGIPLRPGVTIKNALNYQYVELVGNLAPPRTFLLTLDLLF